MADAKICDRCGDFYAGGDDERAVHLTEQTSVMATVELPTGQKNSPSPSAISQDLTRSQKRTLKRSTQAVIPTVDLCPSCYEQLEVWWLGDGVKKVALKEGVAQQLADEAEVKIGPDQIILEEVRD